MVWTSGVKTWKKLAKKGYWVNGSSDSLGEDDPEIKCLSKNKKWVKLTHNLVPKNLLKTFGTKFGTVRYQKKKLCDLYSMGKIGHYCLLTEL